MKKIYDYWKEFAQHVNLKKTGKTGMIHLRTLLELNAKDISSFKDILLSNGSILQSIKSTTDYTITLKFFSDLMIIGKPTREERKSLKKALEGSNRRTERLQME